MAEGDSGRDLASRLSGPLAALQSLAALPVLKQVGVMAGIAASVALGFGVVQWSRTPSYALLYANLGGKESSEVVAGLDRAGVPYRLDPHTGTILVPADDVHRARLTLAGEGLPHSAELGFELLQREPELGTSQFIEQARYQRALEVELARSIATLASVERARVHLALPRQSAFVRERRRPSASVLVHLLPSRTLQESQVAAITHLVSASVPGMEPGDVRLVDQSGRLMTGPEQPPEALLTQREFEHARRLESYYTRRIEEILAPILGVDGVRAQVVADVDFTRTEQTRETYNPQTSAVRSEQLSEDTRPGAGIVGGVPGALSNQPPGAGTAPEKTPAAGQPGAPGTTAATGNGVVSKKVVRNYEVERTVSHTQMPNASLRRLSAAVVLDDLRAIGEDGQVARRAATAEELERFTSLVKEAIGFDAERGDSVSVLNVAFAASLPPESRGALEILDQSWVWDLGKQAVGVLVVLILALGVLRPAMRRLATQAPALAAPGGVAVPAVEAPAAQLEEDKVSLSDQRVEVPRIGPRDPTAQIEALRAVVGQDPKRVAQVVRSWIAEDEPSS